MCKDLDLRGMLREAFALGFKAGKAGALSAEELVDAPGSNVVSIESLRARRSQPYGRRRDDVTADERDA